MKHDLQLLIEGMTKSISGKSAIFAACMAGEPHVPKELHKEMAELECRLDRTWDHFVEFIRDNRSKINKKSLDMFDKWWQTRLEQREKELE